MVIPSWSWLLVSGVFGGLTLAHYFDVLVSAVRRWLVGQPAIVSHFSPKGGCTEAIVRELETARHEVLMLAYSFTSKPIADALVAASARGVTVGVVLDRSNEAETHTELGDLVSRGIAVHIDHKHAIAHNKVIVIDGRTVLTGSFNFTNQAEHENAENLLVLRNHRELAAVYRANIHAHRDHSHPAGEEPHPPVKPHKRG